MCYAFGNDVFVTVFCCVFIDEMLCRISYMLTMELLTRKRYHFMEHDSSDGRGVDDKLGGPEFKCPLWIQ